MEAKAIEVFKQHCDQYLIAPTQLLPQLLTEINLPSKVSYYLTAHIKGEKMTISQFVLIVKKYENLQEQIEQFLDKFGTDKVITLQDLVGILEKKGEKFSLTEIQQFFNDSDADKDGFVGLEDLLQIIKPKLKQ